MAVVELHRSVREGSQKRRIYEICDELYARRRELPSGREVVDHYLAEGGNEGTGFTQYSHWKKAVQRVQDSAASPPTVSDEFVSLAVKPDGSLALPASITAAMGIPSGGPIYVRVRDGLLTAVSPKVALTAVQSMLARSGGSLVDELIRERRGEEEDG